MLSRKDEPSTSLDDSNDVAVGPRLSALLVVVDGVVCWRCFDLRPGGVSTMMSRGLPALAGPVFMLRSGRLRGVRRVVASEDESIVVGNAGV